MSPWAAHTGPEAEQCQRLIEAHKQCLRSEGFKVRDPLSTIVAMPDHGLGISRAPPGCHADLERAAGGVSVEGMGSNVRRRPLAGTAGLYAHADKNERKRRLREECLQRVQQQRSAMLWQLRQVRMPSRLLGIEMRACRHQPLSMALAKCMQKSESTRKPLFPVATHVAIPAVQDRCCLAHSGDAEVRRKKEAWLHAHRWAVALLAQA